MAEKCGLAQTVNEMAFALRGKFGGHELRIELVLGSGLNRIRR